MEKVKPECKLLGEDGNVFNIICLVSRALKKDEQEDKAKEFRTKAMECSSYDEVLRLTDEYVDVC